MSHDAGSFSSSSCGEERQPVPQAQTLGLLSARGWSPRQPRRYRQQPGPGHEESLTLIGYSLCARPWPQHLINSPSTAKRQRYDHPYFAYEEPRHKEAGCTASKCRSWTLEPRRPDSGQREMIPPRNASDSFHSGPILFWRLRSFLLALFFL